MAVVPVISTLAMVSTERVRMVVITVLGPLVMTGGAECGGGGGEREWRLW